MSTWIAFSFLWSFQYFIVSHPLIAPLEHYFFSRQGDSFSFGKSQRRGMKRCYVPVQALNVSGGWTMNHSVTPRLRDRGQGFKLASSVQNRWSVAPLNMSAVCPSSVQLYRNNWVLFMYSDVSSKRWNKSGKCIYFNLFLSLDIRNWHSLCR